MYVCMYVCHDLNVETKSLLCLDVKCIMCNLSFVFIGLLRLYFATINGNKQSCHQQKSD